MRAGSPNKVGSEQKLTNPDHIRRAAAHAPGTALLFHRRQQPVELGNGNDATVLPRIIRMSP